ncbi:methyltransferase FkbM family [Dinoroseobacter shibae DFL 12 = DSM 16493]|jgi:FkbM family methyltransferase|uniref:Methyltransferase FkbM family n=1 Tax=Dinoroseobacter shibae (strain DSM 16493 / NCIMB 14021 / DFL 12) TaxID=398580 RepID=A8LLK2_DINSH|nr:FkbM family methyltransferase [Dinoroseobacter shibae]ABV92012.1 methyltransferase FkbM family [Dinoroseobacter shibae DFL 12 = DSM 16493]URF46979.1 FkbM family methyltransferase [Dinoroseobacter shibae]URF51290.1 FkbM family methyltransferase [Dinoroseobacter shibae]
MRTPFPDRARPARAGLRRSFDIYYRDRARTLRMDRLNAECVAPGGLVFDIGAHVGDRTGSFLRLGAQVVALEPQPMAFRAVQRLYGRCPRATLYAVAAGARAGEVDLLLNSANPTVATIAPAFPAAASGAPGWEGQVWDDRVRVPVTTLDALIAAHGVPDFVKIDVEGHEAEVLNGLSVALPCVSFEVTMIQRDVALACLARLGRLGRYVFNLSLGERHALHLPEWVDAATMAAQILDLPDAANSGDVYARLWSDPDPGCD